MVAPIPFAQLPIPTPVDVARFMRRVTVTETCWLINRPPSNPEGYVQFMYQRTKIVAHRFAFLVAFGWLPDDMLDHLCRVTNCVNPLHLDPVDNRENQVRGIGFVAENVHKTHCLRGHEFAPENTRLIEGGSERVCLTCQHLRAKVQYERTRTAVLRRSAERKRRLAAERRAAKAAGLTWGGPKF